MKLPDELLEIIRCPLCTNDFEATAHYNYCQRCGKKFPMIGETAILTDDQKFLADLKELSTETNSNSIEDARAYLRENKVRESIPFGTENDKKHIEDIVNAWMDDRGNSASRLDALEFMLRPNKLKKVKILDMASGCGTFVYGALLRGWNVYGIEPAIWKTKFIRLKAHCYSYSRDWLYRFLVGVGENLPFAKSSFDIIESYQTLEHVRDLEKCISEFYRVLKPGGLCIVRAPDYMSFYEGHYRLPWLPMMHGPIAERYLKWRGKSTEGLSLFKPISEAGVRSKFLRYKFFTMDLRDVISPGLRKLKRWTKSRIIYNAIKNMADITRCLKSFFKCEKNMAILALKPPINKEVFSEEAWGAIASFLPVELQT